MVLHLTPTETVEVLDETADRLLVRVRWSDGHARPPAHLHPEHAEHFTVERGRIGARVGQVTQEHGPGERFVVPPATVHAMWPVGGPASATWEFRPPGRSLAWFRALDEVHRRGLRGPARGLALAALVGAYDDVFRLATGPARLLHILTRAAALLTDDARRLR